MFACEIAYALPAPLAIESLNLRQQCIPGIMGHSGTRHNCQVGILVAPLWILISRGAQYPSECLRVVFEDGPKGIHTRLPRIARVAVRSARRPPLLCRRAIYGPGFSDATPTAPGPRTTKPGNRLIRVVLDVRASAEMALNMQRSGPRYLAAGNARPVE
jgi:hypothetical protein